MKLQAILVLIATFVATAWSWTLDLHAVDGRFSRIDGELDTPCVNLAFQPILNVNGARFAPATPGKAPPTVFELYLGENCQSMSYRAGAGNWVIPKRRIRSYRVY